MSGIPMMELNAKNPFLWDWENLVMYNTKTIETAKKSQFHDSEIDGMENFEVGSVYSSIDSEIKGSQFTLETNDGFQLNDHRNKREVFTYGSERTSSIMGSSAVSGESLIALELGERTYFEDVSAASNAKNLTSFPSISAAKKPKSSSLNAEVPRCQVEGCNLDLSSAKDYHRKHRVCENHSKSPKVIINGLERRFCQQCSRFHGLSEFVQTKRSCRRRLSDHNARRRKPKPEVIQFNTMRLPTSLYEGGNQLSFAFSQVPMLHNRHDSWDSRRNSKVIHAKPCLFTTIRSGTSDEMLSTSNGIHSPRTKLSPSSTQSLSFQGTSSEIFQRGFPGSMESSNGDGAQDLRALSLLSTSSWGSCEQQQPQAVPLELPISMHANHAPMAGQPLPGFSLCGPPLSSEPGYWQAEQPASSTSGSDASTFQLFKAPNESTFYLY